jgi:hypothetical protein
LIPCGQIRRAVSFGAGTNKKGSGQEDAPRPSEFFRRAKGMQARGLAKGGYTDALFENAGENRTLIRFFGQDKSAPSRPERPCFYFYSKSEKGKNQYHFRG